MAHQIWFWVKSCSGRLVAGVLRDSAVVFGAAPAAVPQLEVGGLAAGAGGGEGGDAHAVTAGDRQLRAGVGTFFAEDDPHAGRPAGQVEQAGGLGDPGAVAGFAVAVVGRLHARAGIVVRRCSVSAGSRNPTE